VYIKGGFRNLRTQSPQIIFNQFLIHKNKAFLALFILHLFLKIIPPTHLCERRSICYNRVATHPPACAVPGAHHHCPVFLYLIIVYHLSGVNFRIYLTFEAHLSTNSFSPPKPLFVTLVKKESNGLSFIVRIPPLWT